MLANVQLYTGVIYTLDIHKYRHNLADDDDHAAAMVAALNIRREKARAD